MKTKNILIAALAPVVIVSLILSIYESFKHQEVNLIGLIILLYFVIPSIIFTVCYAALLEGMYKLTPEPLFNSWVTQIVASILLGFIFMTLWITYDGNSQNYGGHGFAVYWMKEAAQLQWVLFGYCISVSGVLILLTRRSSSSQVESPNVLTLNGVSTDSRRKYFLMTFFGSFGVFILLMCLYLTIVGVRGSLISAIGRILIYYSVPAFILVATNTYLPSSSSKRSGSVFDKIYSRIIVSLILSMAMFTAWTWIEGQGLTFLEMGFLNYWLKMLKATSFAVIFFSMSIPIILYFLSRERKTSQ
ncbi:MAG TPA: hypothetical protein VL728_00960 [Cyclobacteriaceae bacterium]|jgi:hypothetical protein|nr:hypothetical protein [Cyclobacteriaceae bacterium]